MDDDSRKDRDDEGSPANPKGEFILLAVLAVFVVCAMIGMVVIDHYGAPRPEQAARIKDAADR